MGSVHVQCGREDEDEFQEVWPLGAIFGDWIPQLLFSQERRRAELSSLGGAALTISPVPQAPLYLHCCPEPPGRVRTGLFHLRPHTLVTGRKKQSSKERRQHLPWETRAFPEIVSRFVLVSLLELCDGTTPCYKEVSEIQFFKLGL